MLVSHTSSVSISCVSTSISETTCRESFHSRRLSAHSYTESRPCLSPPQLLHLNGTGQHRFWDAFGTDVLSEMQTTYRRTTSINTKFWTFFASYCVSPFLLFTFINWEVMKTQILLFLFQSWTKINTTKTLGHGCRRCCDIMDMPYAQENAF